MASEGLGFQTVTNHRGKFRQPRVLKELPPLLTDMFLMFIGFSVPPRMPAPSIQLTVSI